MIKLGMPGALKAARNLIYLLALQGMRRAWCLLYGHDGVIKERHQLKIFSPLARQIVGVNACQKCGAVFKEALPASDEQDGVRVRLRDLF
jgi:hypothetical protein